MGLKRTLSYKFSNVDETWTPRENFTDPRKFLITVDPTDKTAGTVTVLLDSGETSETSYLSTVPTTRVVEVNSSVKVKTSGSFQGASFAHIIWSDG